MDAFFVSWVMCRPLSFKLLPHIASILAAMGLIFLAYALDRHEIILPTFGALFTGAWLVPENLWHYHRGNLIVSLTLASVSGLLISLAIHDMDYVAVYPSLYVGFLLAACILIFGRTQIYPCFGAMTLPILLRTTSWYYPLSVFCMGLTLVAVQKLLELARAREPLAQGEFPEHRQHRRERLVYYLQTSLGLIPALILVALSENHWFLLPPLFVTYATFCNAQSAFVKYPIQTWGQLVVASAIGNAAVYAAGILESTIHINDAAGEPLLLSGMMSLMAGIAVALMIVFGRFCHRLFPPAVSLVLTPFLIQFNPYMPLFVAITASYLIFIAWCMRTHPAYRGKDLKYL